jgi:hypothetical protein
LSFVPDDNRNSSARLNATRDANFLSRISEIAVEHCVRQGLANRHLDVAFILRHTMRFDDQGHELIRGGQNRIDFASHRHFHLEGWASGAALDCD